MDIINMLIGALVCVHEFFFYHISNDKYHIKALILLPYERYLIDSKDNDYNYDIIS